MAECRKVRVGTRPRRKAACYALIRVFGTMSAEVYAAGINHVIPPSSLEQSSRNTYDIHRRQPRGQVRRRRKSVCNLFESFQARICSIAEDSFCIAQTQEGCDGLCDGLAVFFARRVHAGGFLGR